MNEVLSERVKWSFTWMSEEDLIRSHNDLMHSMFARLDQIR